MNQTVTKATFQKYPAYKDSGVEWLGEIPEHWSLTRIGSHFEERKSKVSDKDFAPLSVTKQGILPQLDSAAKSNDGDNRKLVRKGDFVINSRSDRKGSSGIAIEDGSVSLINIVMKPISINPSFCNYLLKSNAFVEENYRIGHGIVADLWTTRYDEMKNIKIGVPPPKEQSLISNFLDDKTAKIDRAIAQKEKMITLLKERKQIIIQNAVTKGMDSNVKMKDSGVEWIGEVPEGWEVKRVKTCSSRISKGTTPSTEGRLILDDGKIRFIKAENIQDGLIANYPEHYIDEKTNEIIGRSKLQKNDILFVIAGATLGKVAIVSENHLPANTNQAVSFIRPLKDTNPIYLTIWLTCSFIKEIIWLQAVQSAQPNLSMEDLGNMPFLSPPQHEQISIVTHIEFQSTKIDKAIKLQEQQIEKLKELKSTLIDSAVTGKIKVS
jgi:type I restriction enzyme, S subunit